MDGYSDQNTNLVSFLCNQKIPFKIFIQLTPFKQIFQAMSSPNMDTHDLNTIFDAYKKKKKKKIDA